MEKDKIKRLEFLIDENEPMSGIKTISLVDEPAIESDFIKFSKDKPKPSYILFQDDAKKYKQIVAGLALIPDKDILRMTAEGEAYMGYFSTDTIEKLRNKFHMELMNNNVNMDHLEDAYVDAFMVESFIIDSEERLADVKAKGITEVKMGSWYVAYKINDPEVFKRVMNGELRGFSVEAYLDKVFSKVNHNKSKFKFKESMKEIMEKLSALVEEFKNEDGIKSRENFEVAVVAELGAEVEFDGVGSQPMLVESGEVAPDGSHILEDGRTIVVESGVVTEIVSPEAEQEDEGEASQEEGELAMNDEEMRNKEKMDELQSNFDKMKVDFEKFKGENAKLKEDKSKLAEKLSKVPATKPVTRKTESTKKVEKVDMSKLSNYERIAMKNGLPTV